MIASLSGVIAEILDDSIIVDVNGLGFQVFVPIKTINLMQKGENVSLNIVHLFKQEQQILCGFSAKEEVMIFKALIKVPGVGAKSALSILSGLSILDIARAIASQDLSALEKISGVGKKTAERIIVELKEKIKKEFLTKNTQQQMPSEMEDAMLALLSLGYSKKSVQRALDDVCTKLGKPASADEIIIQAIRLLQEK
jgi:Holliday junction DNA helicase RuvA